MGVKYRQEAGGVACPREAQPGWREGGWDTHEGDGCVFKAVTSVAHEWERQAQVSRGTVQERCCLRTEGVNRFLSKALGRCFT